LKNYSCAPRLYYKKIAKEKIESEKRIFWLLKNRYKIIGEENDGE
jgi:hypothetical protein